MRDCSSAGSLKKDSDPERIPPGEEIARDTIEHPAKDRAERWFLRVLKGALIGIGAVLPGLSGGVLMVIFGIYDPLLDFLAHFRSTFRKYIRFFLPILLGGVLGILIFSGLVSAAFGRYAAQFTSLFIGFVVGTVPAIWRTAGAEGRSRRDYVAVLAAAAGILMLMLLGGQELTAIRAYFPVWIAGGILVGLGFIVPGLSPSNFLIYFGLYKKMTDGIASLDFEVLIPLLIGVLLSVVLFARLVSLLFARFYSVMYHIIVGTVIGSSLAIFPTVIGPGLSPGGLAESGLSLGVAVPLTILMFFLGIILSFLFSRLERRVRAEEA